MYDISKIGFIKVKLGLLLTYKWIGFIRNGKVPLNCLKIKNAVFDNKMRFPNYTHKTTLEMGNCTLKEL